MAMLGQVKVGDKIRFVAERVGGALTLTSLEVAKQVRVSVPFPTDPKADIK